MLGEVFFYKYFGFKVEERGAGSIWFSFDDWELGGGSVVPFVSCLGLFSIKSLMLKSVKLGGGQVLLKGGG